MIKFTRVSREKCGKIRKKVSVNLAKVGLPTFWTLEVSGMIKKRVNIDKKWHSKIAIVLKKIKRTKTN